jgi:Ni,Fe-hydrogenase I small subunit
MSKKRSAHVKKAIIPSGKAASWGGIKAFRGKYAVNDVFFRGVEVFFKSVEVFFRAEIKLELAEAADTSLSTISPCAVFDITAFPDT